MSGRRIRLHHEGCVARGVLHHIRAVAGGTEVLPKALTNSLFSQIARGAAWAWGRIHEGVQFDRPRTSGHRAHRSWPDQRGIAVQLEIPSPTVRGMRTMSGRNSPPSSPGGGTDSRPGNDGGAIAP